MDKKGKFGHTKMIVWQEIDKMDTIIQEILRYIPKGEYKTKSQIDTASDSVGSNFVEGYYSGSLGEYIRFLNYSKRSNGELHERVRRVYRKKYIAKELYDKFEDNCIRVMYLIDRTIQSLQKKKEGIKKEGIRGRKMA